MSELAEKGVDGLELAGVGLEIGGVADGIAGAKKRVA